MHTFETARLLMRPLQPEDESFYCTCYTDPLLMRHIGEPLAKEAALRSFRAALNTSSEIPLRRRIWVMQEKESGACTGLLALIVDNRKSDHRNAELGNITLTKFQNRGLTVEALGELVDIVFRSTGLTGVFANYKIQNSAVNRVMKKLGFSHDVSSTESISVGRWVLSRNSWQKLGAKPDSR